MIVLDALWSEMILYSMTFYYVYSNDINHIIYDIIIIYDKKLIKNIKYLN
jgi:hypothetical protein